jgi:hypothetical protein
MKETTKAYHVKHDFGHTDISLPKEGYKISITIDISLKTAFLIGFIFAVCGDVIIHCVK